MRPFRNVSPAEPTRAGATHVLAGFERRRIVDRRGVQRRELHALLLQHIVCVLDLGLLRVRHRPVLRRGVCVCSASGEPGMGMGGRRRELVADGSTQHAPHDGFRRVGQRRRHNLDQLVQEAILGHDVRRMCGRILHGGVEQLQDRASVAWSADRKGAADRGSARTVAPSTAVTSERDRSLSSRSVGTSAAASCLSMS